MTPSEADTLYELTGYLRKDTVPCPPTAADPVFEWLDWLEIGAGACGRLANELEHPDNKTYFTDRYELLHERAVLLRRSNKS